ncbi:MAG: hypothetical protein GY804_00590 [Alphaproteobacteria bacterium]|nr:hypothetical protein [Alphaproteobacteria bacterium]
MTTNTMTTISEVSNNDSTMSNILTTSLVAVLSSTSIDASIIDDFAVAHTNSIYKSVVENQLNQSYIDKSISASLSDSFYDSIVNRPIDKDLLISLIENGYSSINAYSFLESNDEADRSVEDYFGSIEQTKAKKVIFRRRNR